MEVTRDALLANPVYASLMDEHRGGDDDEDDNYLSIVPSEGAETLRAARAQGVADVAGSSGKDSAQDGNETL